MTDDARKTKSIKRFELWLLIASAAGIVVLVATAAVHIPSGVGDVRLISVFNLDEEAAVGLVEKGLENNSLYPWGFYNYGYFYHTLCFAAVRSAELLGHTRDASTIAVTFRVISLVSLVLAAFFTFMVTLRRTADITVSCVAAMLIFAIPSTYYWGQRTHPDVLQMAVISAALLFATRLHTVRNALVAAFLTGVAFGTKYAGAFLFPFLLVPLGLAWWSTADAKSWIKRWLLVSVSAFFLFIIGWVVTNPYAIGHFREFATDFWFETRHVARGHGRAEPANPLRWWSVLSEQFTTVGLVLLAIGAAATVAGALRDLRAAGRRALGVAQLRTDIFLSLYLICGLVYVFFEVHMRRPRMLFHLYPALVVVACAGWLLLLQRFRKAKNALVLLAWLGVVALGARTVGQEASTWQNVEEHPYVKAGRFIEARYDSSTVILADSYSYVPRKFDNVKFVWGVGQEEIDNRRPELLIINKSLSGRWSWKTKGTRFGDLNLKRGDFDGADAFVRFHRSLFGDSAWTVVLENADIVVLEKTSRGRAQ